MIDLYDWAKSDAILEKKVATQKTVTTDSRSLNCSIGAARPIDKMPLKEPGKTRPPLRRPWQQPQANGPA